MNHFCAHDLFQMSDSSVPLQTEQAIRGLIAPFESLFPDSRVPDDVETALPFLSTPVMHSPKQPPNLLFKKDWIEWIYWEVKERLLHAVRFFNLLGFLDNGPPNPLPIILFLREFRHISHISGHLDIISMSGGDNSDVKLLERIEKMFPECRMFWVVNPKDAISYYSKRKCGPNSYPYFASRNSDWLKCIEALAKSANLIVMGNTSTAKIAIEIELRMMAEEKGDGLDILPPDYLNLSNSTSGVDQEIALLKECELVDKTFFSDPEKVTPQLGCVRSVADLTPDCIPTGAFGNYKDILNLPPMGWWLGIESVNYAADFMRAIDSAWGHGQDMGKGRMTGDVIAALFTALAALAVVRGDFAAAAELHLDLANMMQQRPNHFVSIDAIAEGALRESARWYQDNAELFSDVYGIRFRAI
jgi:hypothetical protein